jgi:hypothetical protein
MARLMADRPPPRFVSAAQAVLAALDAARIPACLIGGMVVSRWGQPPATTDTDLSARAPHDEEARVLDILLARFQPRRPDARAFAPIHKTMRGFGDHLHDSISSANSTPSTSRAAAIN